jgi:hypothetical protein
MSGHVHSWGPTVRVQRTEPAAGSEVRTRVGFLPAHRPLADGGASRRPLAVSNPPRVGVRWNEVLGCRFTLDVPVRENQYRGVDLECSSEDLGSFDSEVDSISLDSGDRGLRNACEFRKLILAQLLKFTNNPDGLTDGDLNVLPGFPVIAHNHFFR